MLLMFSCSSSDDTFDIQTYLTENDLEAVDTLGVYVIVNERGTDTIPVDYGVKIELKYTGYYLDQTVFDSSEDTVQLNLSTTLEGLKFGMRMFGKGGSGTIIVPSNLAFGGNPPRGMRSNAVLVYDISLIDFY